MKVALINEISQASKNPVIFEQLKVVAEKYHITAYNTGMTGVEGEESISVISAAAQAFILLNSGAVDFVISGCGTGEAAVMAMNAFPGVYCGYAATPSDAFLFTQINNGNALSMPFGKGIGFCGELEYGYRFEKIFSTEMGMGYPPERGALQKEVAAKFRLVKAAISKDVMDVLTNLPDDILMPAISCREFQKVFMENAKNTEMKEFIKQKLENR